MDTKDKTLEVNNYSAHLANIVITDGKSIHFEKFDGSVYTIPACTINSNIRTGWYSILDISETFSSSILSVLENLGYKHKVSNYTEVFVDRRRHSISIGVRLAPRKQVKVEHGMKICDIRNILLQQHKLVLDIALGDIIPTVQQIV